MKSHSGSMTCDELCALAVVWGDDGPDGTAGGDSDAAARAHLTGCPACRRLLAAQGEARRRLRPLAAASPSAPPPALEARLAQALAAREAKGTTRWRRPAITLAVTAAALAAGAAGYLLLVPGDSARPASRKAVTTGPAASEVARDLHAPEAPGKSDYVIRYRPLGWLEQERPLEGARVARVELRAETAASFGWPLMPDLRGGRVQADVLYGEDGLARAVRFIPTSFRIDTEEGTSP